MSQTQQIKDALDNGAVLTSFDAFLRFKCTKLSTRISELKKTGYKVETRMVASESGARFAEYRKG